jgi:hypothetical protein
MATWNTEKEMNLREAVPKKNSVLSKSKHNCFDTMIEVPTEQISTANEFLPQMRST